MLHDDKWNVNQSGSLRFLTVTASSVYSHCCHKVIKQQYICFIQPCELSTKTPFAVLKPHCETTVFSRWMLNLNTEWTSACLWYVKHTKIELKNKLINASSHLKQHIYVSYLRCTLKTKSISSIMCHGRRTVRIRRSVRQWQIALITKTRCQFS